MSISVYSHLTFLSSSLDRRELFHSSSGARENALKILVVITDGEKFDDPLDYKDVIPEADREGIIRYVIGVGNVALWPDASVGGFCLDTPCLQFEKIPKTKVGQGSLLVHMGLYQLTIVTMRPCNKLSQNSVLKTINGSVVQLGNFSGFGWLTLTSADLG